MSQEDLSKELEISKHHLSQIESNREIPTNALLNSYCNLFNISTSSIMFFSENIDDEANLESARIFISSKTVAVLDFIANRSGRDNFHEK